MASAPPGTAGPAGASFDVDVLEVDRAAGRVRLEGRWSGVRGLRFVRPTLVAGGRQVLATLDDKPWAPHEGAAWRASFPWDGGAEQLAGAVLEVAPSVVVPLDEDARAVPGPATPDSPPGTAASSTGRGRRSPAITPERDGFPLPAPSPAPARESRGPAASAPAPEEPRATRSGAPDPRDDELREVRGALERQRDELQSLRRDVLRLEQQRDEALRDLEAGNRARRRAEERAEEAQAAAHAAQRERDAMRRERDEAGSERDAVRRQRDEVLLAHRTVEQQLQRALAAATTEDRPPPGPRSPAPDGEGAGRDAPDDPDAPIGVRAIPAASVEAPELLAAETAPGREISAADLWAVRILGGAAAICFLLLLVLLVGVFL